MEGLLLCEWEGGFECDGGRGEGYGPVVAGPVVGKGSEALDVGGSTNGE